MAQGRRKRYSVREAIEAFFAHDDNNNEIFDSVYDLDIIPDSENEGDSESSDFDIQIEGLILHGSIQKFMVQMKLKVWQVRIAIKTL